MAASPETLAQLTVPDLPEDVLILIVRDLEAWDLVRCQKVSKAWRRTFSQGSYLREALKRYPDARRACCAITTRLSQPDCSHLLHDADRTCFDQVASRYFHLEHGKCREINRYNLDAADQRSLWYPVGPWTYHESQPNGRLYYEKYATHVTRLGNKPYLFYPTLWSYDDGLVVCALSQQDRECPFSVIDLDTEQHFTVPFRIASRIVRNITLRNLVLVIEWAERVSHQNLNDVEQLLHHHFATCFDVRRQCSETENGWDISFRNEWKLHLRGLPLNVLDRFFSTHNGQHYAVYFWQPNRSVYTGDEDLPIESLEVWDISIASPYRPSLHISNRKIPPEAERPHQVGGFNFRELGFLGICQGGRIFMMNFELNSEANSITVRENATVSGQGYFDPAERLTSTTVTTFPFRGFGPAHRWRCTGGLPPYRGHCSMESAFIESLEHWFVPVMDITDVIADVRLSLVETCFTGISVENKLVVRIKSRGEWGTLHDDLSKEIAPMGRIAGDERWLVGQNASMELVVLKF